MGRKFAVIDTETNWNNQVMSIGIIIARDLEFEVITKKYIVIKEEAQIGGMYSSVLYLEGQKVEIGKRTSAIKRLINYLKENDVESIFAYNAPFDYKCLPELGEFFWHDIIRKAAYKEHNPAIPKDSIFCKTGRLKAGYGVENMLRMFGEKNYCEIHNALTDAVDELRIMKYLNYSIESYDRLI